MRSAVKRKKIFVYLAVIGLLIFLYALGFLSPVENLLARALNPILGETHMLGADFQNKTGSKMTRSELIKENENLKNINVKNITDEAEFNLLKEENVLLRDSLGFLSRHEHDFVMANVISKGEIGDVYGQPEAIVIDRGKNDGVSEGLAVVDSRGSVVGKVSDVKENSSFVCLTNNSKCKFAATILNEERTSGIIEGELGLTIKMGYIPQNRTIKKGDIVITSGLEENVKRGLVVGRVRDVNKENNELWQEAEIESLIELDNLTIVSVIIPSHQVLNPSE